MDTALTGIPVLGFVPKVTECVIESRHLGLVTPAELTDLQERIEKLAEILTDTLDLEAIIRLAEDAPDFTWTPLEQFLPREYQEQSAQVKALSAETLRIGVAKDEAFCFYYEDNLDLLRMLGAETVFFSPLHDQKLPENLQGLLIGGGYPELYAKQLSENESMRRDIREKITAGMPYLAECGGFMYLHESMEDMQTCRWPMAGVLKGNAY